MDGLETRELRYFVAVAEELHFGRAAGRLNMAQPPLSRAIRQLERRLGVQLLDRDRRGVSLTPAGETFLAEARLVLDAVDAAVRRTRRAALAKPTLVLATKAGASHELLKELLDAYAARPQAVEIDVLLCEIGEQRQLLRDGRADVAIMHAPFDLMTGLESVEILTEGQVAILPASHPLAKRSSLTMAEVSNVPDLPIARWPRPDFTYPPGPGPEVRSQSQLAQLVALGRTLLVIPASSRAWQWPEHVAVPVTDAPLATTLLAWPAGVQSPALAALVETAKQIKERMAA
ncbi:LysR family transcriptional regulator [Microbispora rosea subsp. aerata]|nr:LysR family transcriptional regulator [Microbispora rosea]GGO12764.1 LysR family transcriptional regulator [Microbispora rosea subsp. aerata]GIH54127.1 LysR family transcriptional regulator [Microbispora rosea subsp. aerata]GLJ85100.1 LysR family transcriptional regulator [Microbispora rosea subsp. aerata]